MSHVTRYKLHDARECVLPPGNLWKPPASSPPFGSSPAQGDTPYLPVQPASWLRLGSARVLALARRGMPRRAASSAAATSVAQRHSRAGDTPAPHGSLRLPRPPSGRAPAQGIPLASPYSPQAGCVSALPRTRSRSSLHASTCRPPRAAKVAPPSPPRAALAAPKCGPQAVRHLQGDTRPRPLCLPLCYVFAVT